MNAMWIAAVCCLAAEPETWPGFLGAGASSRPQATSVPLAWSPEKDIAWKAPLPGFGQSSPVVWGDRVFLTAVEGPKKEINRVICVALADGKILGQFAGDSSDPVENSVYVSRAAPTPVVDAEHVFAYFESGDVVGLTHDLKPVWQRSLSKEFGKPKNKFGLAASPVQTADRIVILVDDEGPSYLIALAKADGKTLWKTERTSRVSWSSPALVPVGGKPQIVCSSAGSVDGYDPADGTLLWSYKDVGGNTSATPLPIGPGRFLVGASAGREGENAEGAKKSNFAMTVEQIDGKWTPRVDWRTEQASPSFASPMVHDGCAYWVNRVGVVFCFDAATGKLHYSQRIKQSCWAMPLGLGPRVYCFGKDGTTTVLAAGPKFEVLAENILWDPAKLAADPNAGKNEPTEERRRAAANFSGPTQYGTAVVTGSLLVRTGDTLYCLRSAPLP